MSLHGQIDLFEDDIKEGETFVIVVQEVLENNGILATVSKLSKITFIIS